MPNHVTNILKFEGDKEEVEKLLNTIKGKFDNGEEMQIDFDKIIPMPKSLHITSGTSTDYGMAVIQFREHGIESELRGILGYPWVKAEGIKTVEALANYLVKKGSANLDEGRKALDNLKKYGHKDWYSWSNAKWGTKWNAYSQEKVDDNTIRFDTAWATPYPVVEKLSKMFPNVVVNLRFADEDFSYNCGEVILKGGAEIKVNQPKGGSAKAIILAAEVKGYDAEGLIDMYASTEDEEFAEAIINVCTKKIGITKTVDAIIETDEHSFYGSTTMLEVLKGELVANENYELIERVENKIKEIENVKEED